MKRPYLILPIFLFLFINQSFAQQEVEFRHSKSGYSDEFERVVYFHIKEILDQEHADKVAKQMNKDQNLSKVRIFLDVDNKYRCQANLARGVDVQYIRNLLMKRDLDLDLDSKLIRVKNKK